MSDPSAVSGGGWSYLARTDLDLMLEFFRPPGRRPGRQYARLVPTPPAGKPWLPFTDTDITLGNAFLVSPVQEQLIVAPFASLRQQVPHHKAEIIPRGMGVLQHVCARQHLLVIRPRRPQLEHHISTIHRLKDGVTTAAQQGVSIEADDHFVIRHRAEHGGKGNEAVAGDEGAGVAFGSAVLNENLDISNRLHLHHLFRHAVESVDVYSRVRMKSLNRMDQRQPISVIIGVKCDVETPIHFCFQIHFATRFRKKFVV